MADALFAKARRFTDVEDRTLVVWAQALAASLNTEAAAVLDAGLYLEHLTSLLDANLTYWTPEQSAEIARATAVFSQAQDVLAKALAAQEAARAAGSPEQGSGGGAAGPGGGYG